MNKRKPRTPGGRNNPLKKNEAVPFYLGVKPKKKAPKLSKKEQEFDTFHDEEEYPRHHRKPINNQRLNSEEARFARNVLMSLPERPQSQGVHEGLEPLAAYPYMTEQMVKVKEFTKFWLDKHLSGEILPLVPAPKPREYRGTTRRKVFFNTHSLILGFGDQKKLEFPKQGTILVAESAIEPPDHYALYELIAKKLLTKPYRELTEALNFIIIRDTGEKAVIFNVADVNGEVVRKLKLMGELLAKSDVGIVSAWMYHDPSRSEYYLDQKDLEHGQLRSKKLFGFDSLNLTINDIKFRVSPFTFSQVNIPMLHVLVKRLYQFVKGYPSTTRIIDLYCGYGVFSHCLAQSFDELYGIDSSASGIVAAKSLIERRKKAGHSIGSMHFKEAFITKDTVKSHLPKKDKFQEIVILDPPRQGTADGVIQEIAKRSPILVIHVFCAIDEIAKAMNDWKKNGYTPVEVQPFDMFPGTASLETVVLLKPTL